MPSMVVVAIHLKINGGGSTVILTHAVDLFRRYSLSIRYPQF